MHSGSLDLSHGVDQASPVRPGEGSSRAVRTALFGELTM